LFSLVLCSLSFLVFNQPLNLQMFVHFNSFRNKIYHMHSFWVWLNHDFILHKSHPGDTEESIP
jgi:hypothetical protein